MFAERKIDNILKLHTFYTFLLIGTNLAPSGDDNFRPPTCISTCNAGVFRPCEPLGAGDFETQSMIRLREADSSVYTAIENLVLRARFEFNGFASKQV